MIQDAASAAQPLGSAHSGPRGSAAQRLSSLSRIQHPRIPRVGHHVCMCPRRAYELRRVFEHEHRIGMHMLMRPPAEVTARIGRTQPPRAVRTRVGCGDQALSKPARGFQTQQHRIAKLTSADQRRVLSCPDSFGLFRPRVAATHYCAQQRT